MGWTAPPAPACLDIATDLRELLSRSVLGWLRDLIRGKALPPGDSNAGVWSPFAQQELSFRSPPGSWCTAMSLNRELDSQHVMRVMTRCRLSRCLAEVAVLRHAGLTDRQIAIHLDIPLATVRGRVRRIYAAHALGGVSALVLLVERALNSGP